MSTVAVRPLTSFAERLQALRRTRLAQTAEKQRVIGSMDYDDWALVLPPPELRKIVSNMGASGVEIKDCLLSTFAPEPNHPSGGFFGPVAVGRNFRRLLEAHPAYVDPMSSLAGAYMTNFFSYRRPHWNPDYSFDFLAADHAKYRISHGIGGAQHFCQDFTIGLELGWNGIREKIARYRAINRDQKAQDFYEGLENVVLGIQDWIGRTAAVAETVAAGEQRPDLRADLLVTARVNRKLRTDPPETFREACQWILWHLLVARMYDGSGSVGRLDDVLLPFYRRDLAAGILTDEEAVFHIACILVRDTGYIQLGGYDKDGRDNTNPVSFFILEAIDRLKLTANAGVAVGVGIDPALLRKGVEMILRNRNGNPKFLGFDVTSRGFARNGHPLPLGWNRVYSGCHWSAIPGREYTLNDIVKINLGVVFDVALHEMMAERPEGGRHGPALGVLRETPAARGQCDRPRHRFSHVPHGRRFPRARPGPSLPWHHREGKGRRRGGSGVLRPGNRRNRPRHRGRLVRGPGAAAGKGKEAGLEGAARVPRQQLERTRRRSPPPPHEEQRTLRQR